MLILFDCRVATYVNTPKGVAVDRLALKPALQVLPKAFSPCDMQAISGCLKSIDFVFVQILESAISCENAASQRVEAEITLPNLVSQ